MIIFGKLYINKSKNQPNLSYELFTSILFKISWYQRFLSCQTYSGLAVLLLKYFQIYQCIWIRM